MKVSERPTTRASSIASYGRGLLSAWRLLPERDRFGLRAWAACIAAATFVFGEPLFRLLVLARENALHSHIPLVPVVAAYLLLIKRSALPETSRSIGAAIATAVPGVAAVAAVVLGITAGADSNLTLLVFAYVAFIVATGFLFMGAPWMAAAAFPVAFLLFMVPMPAAAEIWLEDALVLASADVSAWMIQATGTPMLRQGTIFTLPTIVLEVARECSGIRSTFVLFITSLVAAHMFLESPWRRLVLVAFVIPLGVIRNGFRILTIALLCVHVGPHMIDSFIHHRGGPIFFALSLVPLFMLLAWLRRRDPA